MCGFSSVGKCERASSHYSPEERETNNNGGGSSSKIAAAPPNLPSFHLPEELLTVVIRERTCVRVVLAKLSPLSSSSTSTRALSAFAARQPQMGGIRTTSNLEDDAVAPRVLFQGLLKVGRRGQRRLPLHQSLMLPGVEGVSRFAWLFRRDSP